MRLLLISALLFPFTASSVDGSPLFGGATFGLQALRDLTVSDIPGDVGLACAHGLGVVGGGEFVVLRRYGVVQITTAKYSVSGLLDPYTYIHLLAGSGQALTRISFRMAGDRRSVTLGELDLLLGDRLQRIRP